VVKPHHDVCRITDATVTREDVAFEMGRQAFLERMLYDKSNPNPFNNNPHDSAAWRRGFDAEYADHQTITTKGIRLIKFSGGKK